MVQLRHGLAGEGYLWYIRIDSGAQQGNVEIATDAREYSLQSCVAAVVIDRLCLGIERKAFPLQDGSIP